MKKLLVANGMSVALLTAEVLVGLLIFANVWIPFVARHSLYHQISSIPCREVGLVLGASPMLGPNHPNYFFRYRIDAAAKLYHAGKVRHLIVSGDNHSTEYDEPTAMRDALIRKGVPASAISLDYAGFRTLDSIVRAKKIFGQDRLVIISQAFHNERALYIAQQFGIDAIGWNARDIAYHKAPKTYLREYPARLKAWLDITILRTQPRFLGKEVKLPRLKAC